jgi:CheY-like chemotaxis protein
MSDPTERKRILIVDDEPNIAETLVLILGRAGYEAVAVSSAEEALVLVTTWLPDEAILDVNLPGMHGIDLAVRLKTENPTMTITLLSGHTGTFDRLEKAREDGHILQALAKPIHPADLLRHLAESVSEDQVKAETDDAHSCCKGQR